MCQLPSHEAQNQNKTLQCKTMAFHSVEGMQSKEKFHDGLPERVAANKAKAKEILHLCVKTAPSQQLWLILIKI